MSQRSAELLALAYESIFPLCFGAIIWLTFTRQHSRVWELALGFGASIQASAMVSVFWPALGNIVHAGQSGLVGNGLPEGAGVYHLDAVAAYREGLVPVLDTSNLAGVVTFPSFHTVMAIVLAYAVRGTGWLGLLASGWCSLVIISTVPIGGLYVIDVLAEALLWGAIMVAPAIMDRKLRETEAHRISGAASVAAA